MTTSTAIKMGGIAPTVPVERPIEARSRVARKARTKPTPPHVATVNIVGGEFTLWLDDWNLTFEFPIESLPNACVAYSPHTSTASVYRPATLGGFEFLGTAQIIDRMPNRETPLEGGRI